MAREYGKKQSRSGLGPRVEWRYVATLLVGATAFVIPKVIHDHALVGIAESVLWLGFIGWVILAPRQK